jgi:hypothetical protein
MLNGYDFRIMKTHQGEYADYTNSEFVRKASAVPEDILSKVDLYDLKNYRYGKIERDQMETMIEAFMTGKSYEAEKSVAGEQPIKETRPAGEVLAQAAAAQPAAVPAQPSAPTAATSATGKNLSPQEILKRLRDRQAAQAAGTA